MTRGSMLWAAILVAIAGATDAQWVHHVPAGTPLTRDGQPDLSAPAPRGPERHPDLSGVWQAESSPIPELRRLVPSAENGLGEDIPNKYFISVLADYAPGSEPLQPAAAAAVRGRSLTVATRDDVGLNCLPSGMPLMMTTPTPFKIVQTRSLVLVLAEADMSFRQIFTDGRAHPEDPQPSWIGSSVGRWDGDTLVVETVGFNDRGQLDVIGHRHSTALRLTER
jgi:hypothetical protein